MSLKVELKPGEKLLIGNCVVTNGDQRARRPDPAACRNLKVTCVHMHRIEGHIRMRIAIRPAQG